MLRQVRTAAVSPMDWDTFIRAERDANGRSRRRGAVLTLLCAVAFWGLVAWLIFRR